MAGKDGVQILNDEKQEQRLEDPFDTFSVPAINDDYAYHDDHFIEPSTNVTQTGPIVFEFETSGGERFDSNYTELETHYQIWDKSGVKTTDADNISVINSLPIAHFDKIEVKMNDKIVTNSSSGNHAFHAYFQQKFSYSKAVKNEILKKTEFYYEDDPRALNQFEVKKEEVNGVQKVKEDVFWQKSKMFVKDDHTVVCRSQLYMDIFNVHKYFPTDIDYVITLTRNPESFCLMGPNGKELEYKIKIMKIRLIVRKIMPSDARIAEAASLINSTIAYIPYTHGIMTSQLMPIGTRTKVFRDVCTINILPKQLFVFMMPHLAYSGNMELNPFSWNHHKIQKISFTARGKHHPMVPYDLDFENNDFHRAYMDFLNAIGVSRNNTSPNITMEMYKKYCCVFALDLQPDQCNSLHIHSGKTGTVNVEMTFRSNLEQNLQVCFLEYHDQCLTFKREEGKPKIVVDVIDSNILAGV